MPSQSRASNNLVFRGYAEGLFLFGAGFVFDVATNLANTFLHWLRTEDEFGSCWALGDGVRKVLRHAGNVPGYVGEGFTIF